MRIEKRVECYKNNLLRLNELKKKMIDAELTWIYIRDYLELTQYELTLLKSGNLRNKESEIWELIETTPLNIINRNKELKLFQKALIDKGLRVSDVLLLTKMTKNKLYRTLNKTRMEPDLDAQRKIEEVVGVSIF